MISFKSSGEHLYKKLMTIVLIQTDLPLPVLPAMSRCGIRVRSATWHAPAMSLPSASVSGELFLAKVGDSKILRMLTEVE